MISRETQLAGAAANVAAARVRDERVLRFLSDARQDGASAGEAVDLLAADLGLTPGSARVLASRARKRQRATS